MEIKYGNKGDIIKSPTVVGLGAFDGIHIGHMTLINTVIDISELSGLMPVIYTFEKNPGNILGKKIAKPQWKELPLIISNEHKINILENTRISTLYFDEFNEAYSHISAEDFAREILIDKLHARHVVVGYDFRFGYRAQATAETLKELGLKYDFAVTVIPAVKSGDVIASSTNIRGFIEEGRITDTNNLLGRHYSITGVVRPGKRIGRTLGVPTANIYPAKYLVMPLNGVYITMTQIKGRRYKSITNVGINPTVTEINKDASECGYDQNKDLKVMETHIIDFDQNIYNENIEVFFIDRLREEKKFRDVEVLANQIMKDIASARKYFDNLHF